MPSSAVTRWIVPPFWHEPTRPEGHNMRIIAYKRMREDFWHIKKQLCDAELSLVAIELSIVKDLHPTEQKLYRESRQIRSLIIKERNEVEQCSHNLSNAQIKRWNKRLDRMKRSVSRTQSRMREQYFREDENWRIACRYVNKLQDDLHQTYESKGLQTFDGSTSHLHCRSCRTVKGIPDRYLGLAALLYRARLLSLDFQDDFKFVD